MPKRDERHMAAVRQQILEAARVVFESKGVAEASMSDVSAQAGLSVGSIYVHFRSKDDVLKQLIATVDTQTAPFDACATADELLQLVEATLQRQTLSHADAQAARTALEVAAIARRNPEIQALVAKNYELLRGAVQKAVLRIAAPAGLVDKAEARAIAEALLSLLVSAQAQMLIGVPTDTTAKVKSARVLIGMLHRAPVKRKA